MVNKASGNQFQIQPGVQSKIGVDPSVRPGVNAEKPVQKSQRDETTTAQVRTGASVAPTAEQAIQNQGGALQAQIAARTPAKARSRGRRTGALREPNAAQLLRSMKNPEAMKEVLALQGSLQKALVD